MKTIDKYLNESSPVDKLEKEMKKIKDLKKLPKWFEDNVEKGKGTKGFEILDYKRIAARYRDYHRELFDKKYTMWT